jgi:hypothetical protein
MYSDVPVLVLVVIFLFYSESRMECSTFSEVLPRISPVFVFHLSALPPHTHRHTDCDCDTWSFSCSHAECLYAHYTDLAY